MSKKNSLSVTAQNQNSISVTAHEKFSQSKGRMTRQRTVVMRDQNGNTKSLTKTSSFNMLGFVMLVLIVVALVRVLMNGAGDTEYYTLRGFLEMLSNVPEIDISWITFDILDFGLPDSLSWLNVLLETFQFSLSLVGFFVTGIVQVVLYFSYFLAWLF